jgi:oxalate decarboxylase/phosphoglucose isomerase-like protein (cupin superfamily)
LPVTHTPERLQVGADELTFRVTSEQSGGALLAIEVRLPAGGGPPALHRHAPAEVYRVHRGELAIYVEDDAGEIERIATAAGSVVHIPAGRAHTVRNESDADAHAYVVFTPGTEIERFMRAAGALTDPAEVMALAERHGIEMLRTRSTAPTG